MQEYIIETQALSKVYNAGKANEVVPVKDVTLKVLPNTCNLLQGSSGSGKTTLLSVLSCLSKPSAGSYYCKGQRVSRWSEKFLTRFRRENLGIIFQNFRLISGLSVYLNIALPLFPLAYSRQVLDQMVRQAAEEVGLMARLNFKVDTLSGGEMQRVAIARALVNTPDILFADEPTAHLDRKNSEAILALLEQLKEKGKTIFITSHDPLVQQHLMIDQTFTLNDGQLT